LLRSTSPAIRSWKFRARPSPWFRPYAFDQGFDLSHFDLYRLEEPEELDELGLDEICWRIVPL
jgi:hypothetical protein